MSTNPNARNTTCQDDETADRAFRLRDHKPGLQKVLDLAAEGRRTVLPGTGSAHDDLYDEHGVPR